MPGLVTGGLFVNPLGSLYQESGTSAPVPPTINSVTLDNITPTVGDVITATVDAPGATSFAYQWLADGGQIGGETNPTYTADRTNAMGHTIECVVVASNSAGDSAPITSPPTLQVTGAPQFDSSPTASPSSVSVSSGGTATCDPGNFSGFPIPDVSGFVWDDSAATNGPTYAAAFPDDGGEVACTVTISNGVGDASAQSNFVSVND